MDTLKPTQSSGYSIPKISEGNSTYSNPPNSIFSSKSTYWPIVDETSENLSSAQGTSRLPSVPAFATFKFPRPENVDDFVTFSPIYYH